MLWVRVCARGGSAWAREGENESAKGKGLKMIKCVSMEILSVTNINKQARDKVRRVLDVICTRKVCRIYEWGC